MIYNSSMIHLNVTFKGREVGFAPFESKRKLYKFYTDAEQKQLAGMYPFLIFKPDKKKDIKKTEEAISTSEKGNASKLTDIIESAKEKLTNTKKENEKSVKDVSPTADYTEKDSVILAEKETIIRKEDDVKDIEEGKETISLSKPPKKKVEISEESSDEKKKTAKKKTTKKKTAKKKTTKKDNKK